MTKKFKALLSHKKTILITLFFFLFFPSINAYAFSLTNPFGGLVGTIVHAVEGSIQNTIISSIEAFLQQAEGQIIQFSVNLLNFLIFSPTDLASIPGYLLILHSIQGIATAIALLLAVKEFFASNFDPDGRSPQEIVLGLIKSVALIFGIPFIFHFLIDINNGLANMIMHISISQAITDSSTLKAIGTAMVAGSPLSAASPVMGGMVSQWIFAELLVVAIIAVALITVAIQNGIRFVELLFLLAAGPLLATTKVSNSDLFDVWGREVLAVIFAESVQVFSLHMGIVLLTVPLPITSLAGSGVGVASFVVGIGGFLFAMRGPRTLRQLMFRAGGGGGSALRQAGQIAMMLVPK